MFYYKLYCWRFLSSSLLFAIRFHLFLKKVFAAKSLLLTYYITYEGEQSSFVTIFLCINELPTYFYNKYLIIAILIYECTCLVMKIPWTIMTPPLKYEEKVFNINYAIFLFQNTSFLHSKVAYLPQSKNAVSAF